MENFIRNLKVASARLVKRVVFVVAVILLAEFGVISAEVMQLAISAILSA